MVIDTVGRRAFAESLATEAGQLALSYHNQNGLEVRSKGVLDGSPKLTWQQNN